MEGVILHQEGVKAEVWAPADRMYSTQQKGRVTLRMLDKNNIFGCGISLDHFTLCVVAASHALTPRSCLEGHIATLGVSTPC